jgi:GTPase SAR1 family protein
MSQTILGICRQTGCMVAKDGKCLEGFEPITDCPHFVAPSEAAAEDEVQPAPKPDQQITEANATVSRDTVYETVELYSGKELDYTSALRITKAALTRIVVLVGGAKSGKTTLLVSLYEWFLQKPLAGYMFAGSDCLPAFDERCHLSRIESQRDTEDTERTKSMSTETMLHLQVRDQNLEKPAQDILLSDINGEIFDRSLNSASDIKEVEILKRADHLTLLLDGEKLSSLHSRNQAATSGDLMLRSFVEAGMIGINTYVQVVFTKDDLLIDTTAAEDTEEFIQFIEQELNRKYKDKLGRLEFFRIAARPKEGGTDSARGLSAVFKVWVEDTPLYKRYERINRGSSARGLTSKRSFDTYLIKSL